MAFHIFLIRKEYQPFAVRRGVSEPVVVFVGDDGFLAAAVGMHAPNFHFSGAVGVEVDVFTVGRILRAVVEAGRGGEALFATAGCGDGVDVELAVALGTIRQRLAVRRPAVPIGRREWRDFARLAAGDWQNVDA